MNERKKTERKKERKKNERAVSDSAFFQASFSFLTRYIRLLRRFHSAIFPLMSLLKFCYNIQSSICPKTATAVNNKSRNTISAKLFFSVKYKFRPRQFHRVTLRGRVTVFKTLRAIGAGSRQLACFQLPR
jgi:hypothetical protein